jgi:hypothetical protein
MKSMGSKRMDFVPSGPGAAELVEEAPIGQCVPSVERPGRAGAVTAAVLQALAGVGQSTPTSYVTNSGPGRSRSASAKPEV